jgi:predicted DNA-binding protein
VAAVAVLAVWRHKPHQAKFFAREHFGKLYDVIFTQQLNGTQVAIAVQLYRLAENRRKRPEPDDPPLVRYASCFIAMQMGRRLLAELNGSLEKLSHHTFKTAQLLIEQQGEAYFNAAVQDLQRALQQLAATFRRGDLISILQTDDPVIETDR